MVNNTRDNKTRFLFSTFIHYSFITSGNMSSEENFQFETEIKIIDAELLVSHIQNRPILWDKAVEELSDWNEKQRAWREVYCLMTPEFEKLGDHEQKLIGR